MDYNARMYDPSLMRFVQPDTIVAEPGSTQGLNRFSYTNNNPVRYIDPSGHGVDCGVGQGCMSANPLAQLPVEKEKPIVQTLTPTKPNIVSRSEWGAHEPGSFGDQNGDDSEGLFDENTNPSGYKHYKGNLSDIYDTVVIHHEGDDQTYNVLTVQEAEMWSGFYDIGYAFIIGSDGQIYEGRDINYRGNNVYPNTGKIGILWLGDFNPGIGENHSAVDLDDVPTEAQVHSTINLISWLDYNYGIKYIAGHNAFNQPGYTTLCPGLNAAPYVQQVKDYFGR